ncbi:MULTISPECIES: anthranilate synthase component I [unclassified Brevibacterium]|uniref:anthranilate synthase component I n=1 Tax=unclassified Brevibacterium TaxID=2614124 RepID=UPI0010C7A3E2|nr:MULTISPECIES: anthranilate synthase component I [unclassified Brevibacterium]MCK1802526.1 anthranilate synthase component I [Brevibacterium sp. R8603A2]QCP05864.1 anthranilate synthase component I [Brevibacterium sp. CS2]
MSVTPTREEFRALGADHRLVPLYTTVLADSETPLSIYRRLAGGRPGGFLLESATSGVWSRYSFIGRHPIATLTEVDGEVAWLGTPPAGAPTSGDPLTALRATLELLHIDVPHPDLPPMISSLVGYLGWDVVRRFERLGHGPLPEDAVPELSLSIPGDVAIFDHSTSRVTLVANVVNVDGRDSGIDAAYDTGRARLAAMIDDLLAPAPSTVAVHTPLEPEVKPRTPREEYLESVLTAKQEIVDGEIFQVVLGQRFDSPCDADPLDVYRMLRTTNPSPYMYLLDVPTPDGRPLSIVGSSPEALVTVKAGHVVTHPIAGSRPRGATPEEDHELARDLLADEKERAEHLMLVDLARNDLSKVCEPGSVDVVEFMEIERYSHIMHIVSTVTGSLDRRCSGVDVLAATFPAGTLSGAPKPRALEIIDRLEPTARGVYGGVVGYLSFTGDLDVAIAIRTGIMRPGVISVSAGAGIVADSVPDTEYIETQNKAAAVLRAAAAAHTLRTPGTEPERTAGAPR